VARDGLEPELIHGAPLRYAPTNEMGVVFIFAQLARRMQVHVQSVQAGFPDCIAYQRVGGKERRIRIEFEFRSSNFRTHRHDADGCDWIVCWEHDWPDVPERIKVVELREYFDHGFNVWVDVGGPHEDWPTRGNHSFGKRVSKGDLVLFYEASPNQWLRHIYAVTGTPSPKCPPLRKNYDDTWDGKTGLKIIRHVHDMRRVCVLDPPLPVKRLETVKLSVIHKAIFSQQHNRKITEHWWLLHDLLVRKYPEHGGALKPFAPSKL
jgi:hypothetical protein